RSAAGRPRAPGSTPICGRGSGSSAPRSAPASPAGTRLRAAPGSPPASGRGPGPRSAPGRPASRRRRCRSSVDPAEYRVEHPEAADHVGDIAVEAHVPERLQVDEARVADVDPRRLRGAVGEDVAAELAAGALDRVVD